MENVLFGAEFTGAGEFVKGMNEMVASGKKMIATEQELTETLEKSDQKLVEHRTEVAKLKEVVQGAEQVAKKLNETTGSFKPVFVDTAPAIQKFKELQGVFVKTFKEMGEAGGYKGSYFTSMLQDVERAKGNMKQMQLVVDELKGKLGNAEVGTEKFTALAQVIGTAEQVMQSYNEVVQQSTTVTVENENANKSMRTRIMELRNALTALEDAGKENTAEYRNMQRHAAELTDQFGDMQNRIRILSSDTKNIDFGVAAVNAAVAGFQVLSGAMELFGFSSEEAAEAQRKLMALMNLAQGVQMLSNLLLKDSTLFVVGQDLAERALGATNLFVAETFGISAAAAGTFSKVLLGTGIGAVVALLGYFVYTMMNTNKELSQGAQLMKNWNDIVTQGDQKAGEHLSKLKLLYAATQDLTLSEKERLKAAKELNKEFPETFKNFTAQQILLGDAKKAYDELTQSIINNARAEAARSKIAEIESKILDAQFQQQKIRNAVANESKRTKTTTYDLGMGMTSTYTADQQKAGIKSRGEEAVKAQQDTIDKLTAQEKAIIDLVGLGNLVDGIVAADKGKETAAKKDIENVFEQMRRDLQTKLFELNKTTLIDDDTIRANAQHMASLLDSEVSKALKEKKLTKSQAEILHGLIGQISAADMAKELREWNDKRMGVMKTIDDALLGLQQEDAAKRAALLKNSFDKEGAQIDVEYQKSFVDLKAAQGVALAGLQKDFNDGLFGNPNSPAAQQAYRLAVDKYKALYGKLLDDLLDDTIDKKTALAVSYFNQGLSDIERTLEETKSFNKLVLAGETETLARSYLEKKLSFSAYVKQLGEVRRTQDKEDTKAIISNLEEEARRLQHALSTGMVTGKDGINRQVTETDRKALEDRLRGVNNQLSDAHIKQATDDAQFKQDEREREEKHVQAILNSYKEMFDAIAGLMEQMSKSEEERLTRQIALQNTRVENAKYLAEKGNAAYLEMEQKRMDELTRRQEQMANRQLAMNNAVAMSNAIVAATGAIAHAASTGDVFDIVASVAAVIGALAAAYSFVNSFQKPVASFYEGEAYVDSPTASRGRDTIPAMLNIGERVITTDTNAQYATVLDKIHRKEIPPEVLNTFAAQYGLYQTPALDFGRLGIATDRHLGGETVMLAQKLDTLINLVSEQGEEGSKEGDMVVNFDEHGFSMSLMKTVRKIQIRQRMI